MLIFAGIIVLPFVLGLIVYALHRYQSMEVEYTVDRTMPLPPLKEGLIPVNLPSLDRLNPDIENPHQPHTAETNQVQNNPSIDQNDDESDARTSYSGNWQEQVIQAKQAGDFAFAAQLCETRFPTLGSIQSIQHVAAG